MISTMKRYRLRLTGLDSDHGKIKARELVRALHGLVKAAERATSLLATGEGVRRGPKPAWLAEALDLTVVGLGTGSTVIEVESPALAGTPFHQGEFWPGAVRPQPTDTALDLASLAIREAKDDHARGDRFDGAVLDAVIELGKIGRTNATAIELLAGEGDAPAFALDRADCHAIEARRRSIPQPRACIISGKLDQIAHGSRRFRLEVGRGQAICGRLIGDATDLERLRPLWGRPATVQGSVHFRADGQPRLIEADRIAGSGSGHEIFSILPQAADVAELPSPPSRTAAHSVAKPSDLIGAWPGEESVEQLLSVLRKASASP